MGCDVKHAVMKELDLSFVEETEASRHGFVEVWGFLRLGRVKEQRVQK
jgi:hypothetical protein